MTIGYILLALIVLAIISSFVYPYTKEGKEYNRLQEERNKERPKKLKAIKNKPKTRRKNIHSFKTSQFDSASLRDMEAYEEYLDDLNREAEDAINKEVKAGIERGAKLEIIETEEEVIYNFIEAEEAQIKEYEESEELKHYLNRKYYE